MGVAASTNQMLKLITLFATLAGAFVLVRACSRGADVTVGLGEAQLPGAVSRTDLSAEGDTEEETLRTLIGEVRGLHDEYDVLEADNEQLREQNTRLQNMENRIESRLEDELEATQVELEQETLRVQRQSRDTDNLLERLERRLAELTDFSASPRVDGSDIPVGLGFDTYFQTEKVVWIDPLDAPPPDANGDRIFPQPIESVFSKISGEPLQGESDQPGLEPVYTVPRNATLVGARGFTALVGRIPVGGQVVDPFPFKVLVGEDNLAANGIVVPELFGMVFSGRAVGDWTLSCVRGEVFSVTYVFQDGSIQSYPEGDLEIQESRPIGWISDAYGVPCVTGERRTNAQSFLTQRIGLSAAAAAAEAAAASETTTTVSGATGTSTSAVTGDTTAFVRNRTVSAGIDEISRWLDERQAQSFDVIYVPPGNELVVHVTRELGLDRDPQGRKVNHHVVLQTNSNRDLD